MTEEQQSEILLLVKKSLEIHYNKRVLPALSLVVSVAERYPEQTDNQVRNALTHYTRALFSVDDFEEAKKEIASAENHLERGVRDAYKIVLVILGSQIQNLFDAVLFAKGELPSEQFQQYENYISLRSALYSYESLNKLPQIFDDFPALTKLSTDPFEAVITTAVDVRGSLLSLTRGMNPTSKAVLQAAQAKNWVSHHTKRLRKWLVPTVVIIFLAMFLQSFFKANVENGVDFIKSFVAGPANAEETVDK